MTTLVDDGAGPVAGGPHTTAQLRGVAIGLANLAALAGITWLVWYVLLHPNGVLAFYTPMYGFSLVATLLAVIVFMSRIAEGWPFSAWPLAWPIRGAVMTAVALGAVYGLVHGLFWGGLGRVAVTYFSPYAIIAEGGVGAEFFNAREIASTAIVYFDAAFLVVALVWSAGVGRWPWHRVPVGVRVWSKTATVVLLSGLLFLVAFHPHVAHLFYPAQSMAGVTPWWRELSMTSSAFFNLGVLLCVVMAVVLSELTWEGEPWGRFDRQGGAAAKGVTTLLGSALIGLWFLYLLWQLMNALWYEPFVGGQRLDGPHFRYLHAGEVAGFVILSAYILKVCFGNGPGRGSLAMRALVRTALILAGAVAMWFFYYSPLATLALGKVPGIASPDDTSLVVTLLFLCVVLIQAEFFGRGPRAAATVDRPGR